MVSGHGPIITARVIHWWVFICNQPFVVIAPKLPIILTSFLTDSGRFLLNILVEANGLLCVITLPWWPWWPPQTPDKQKEEYAEWNQGSVCMATVNLLKGTEPEPDEESDGLAEFDEHSEVPSLKKTAGTFHQVQVQ